jgi:stress-induced morphogen
MTADQLKKRLEESFRDAKVAVIDMTGTNDHYEVIIEASALKALSRIKQHQAVMSVFDTELKTGEIHALTIKTKFEE